MWSPIPRRSANLKRLGLIVNPRAGIGGRVGLKGSDGAEIQQRALELGAVPQAGKHTAQCLHVFAEKRKKIEIITPPGEMGELIAREAGFEVQVVGEVSPGATTAQDTILSAQTMLASEVDLLLFAGGDGTARDIYQAIGDQLVVIGIPAGVKINSAVFATHPYAAGELVAAIINAQPMPMIEAEVVDIDEQAYREGFIISRLYGYLWVPYHHRLMQNRKAPTPVTEDVQIEAIAREVVENMQEDILYVLGPGTTTRAVAERLGLQKTLVGVDVVTIEGVVAIDVGEAQLLSLIENREARIIMTPIGGQGFLFGRGNQPISPNVIEKIGVENIQVISTPQKLHNLNGRALLVDTGDADLDTKLSGHISITTGYREQAVYRIAA
jgi:predicted polyphosphate/ATP-dependent NAD kinase